MKWTSLFTLAMISSSSQLSTEKTTTDPHLFPSTSSPKYCHTVNDPVCSYPLKSRCNVLRRRCDCPLGTQLTGDHCTPIHCTSGKFLLSLKTKNNFTPFLDDICNLDSDYHLVCSNSTHPDHHVLGVHGQPKNISSTRGVCICNPAYFYPSMDGFACQLRQSIIAAITFAVLALFGLLTLILLYVYGPCCTEDDC